MSDPRGHDRDPDKAALDELLRAFAVDDDPDVTGDDELLIVEQDPLPETAPTPRQSRRSGDRPIRSTASSPEPQPGPGVDERESTQTPRVIRIDDLGGIEPRVTVVDPATPVDPVDVPREPTPPAAGIDDDEPQLISIDDAALPDAVYIEGSLDRDGSRSIVFIEDDDTGDALVPESERDIRRGIEPRMRERRLAVKRMLARKRLKWVIAIVVVIVLGVGALALLGSSLFAIQADQVTVTGNVYTDQEQLQEIVDDLVGTPALLVDTTQAERDIEAIPWVADAKVTAHFPHALSIEINEREAMTTYQGPDGRFRVLDAEGRVLDVLDMYPFAYVLLRGPDPVDLDPGEFAPEGYVDASQLAKNLTGSVRGRVDHIEATADGSSVTLWLDDGTEVRFGEGRDILAKLIRLETVLASDDDRESTVIDVSTRVVTS